MYILLLFIILIVASVNFAVSLHFGVIFQMLARDNCFFILLGAIITFYIVIQMKPRAVGWINQLATYVFPVYIIHYVLLYYIVYIPINFHHFLFLEVWMNAFIITMVAMIMEYIRRCLFSSAFNELLIKELMMVERIKSNLIKRL